MKIALYENFFDNKPGCVEMNWAEIVEILTTFPDKMACSIEACVGKNCAHKMARAGWSPVTIKDGGKRDNDDVETVNALALDLDHHTDADLAAALESVNGQAAVIHSTHSHAPPDGAYRLVLSVSREMTPAEYRIIRQAVIETTGLRADPQTKDLARLFALPDVRTGVSPYFKVMTGAPLDVDGVLHMSKSSSTAAPSAPGPIAPSEPVDLGALRTRLAEVRRSKASSTEPCKKEQAIILGRVLDREALAETGARDGTLLRAAGLLAYWSPAGTPIEALVEILRPSLSAMDCKPEGLDHWLSEATKKLSRQMESRQEADARRAKTDAMIQGVLNRVKPRSTSAAELVEDVEDEDEDAWKVVLLRDKKGNLRACEFNARHILACDPETRRTIFWNDVTKEIEIRGGPLAGVPGAVLETATASWLQLHYNLMVGAGVAGRALLDVARQNATDPIAEYLSEIAWDGTARIDDFLISRCHAVTKNDRGEDINEHLRRISRMWFIALVARALTPGCQMDTVLVLDGKQGIKKSSLLRALGGAWFADTELNLEDKDTKLLVSTAWIIELAELTSILRGRFKGFVTAVTDKFRPPYGRVIESFPRRAVLVGSTNDDKFLDDPTGLRRFWPVHLADVDIDVEAVKRDRDQLFAEAVTAFRAGERWWLNRDEAAVAEVQAQERRKELKYRDQIWAWWSSLPTKVGTVHSLCRSSTLFTDTVAKALNLSADRVDAAVRRDIGFAMADLGFERNRETDGARRWFYQATAELLKMVPSEPSKCPPPPSQSSSNSEHSPSQSSN
jgi:Virulence-associated protein E